MKLSDLLERPVITADGRKLGHLLDLRIASSGGVVEGIYGMWGFLERIGFKKGSAKGFRWDRVIAIEPDRIVIAANRRARD
jgi:sporulation protein YlmC with PRC-barrel domain